MSDKPEVVLMTRDPRGGAQDPKGDQKGPPQPCKPGIKCTPPCLPAEPPSKRKPGPPKPCAPMLECAPPPRCGPLEPPRPDSTR